MLSVFLVLLMIVWLVLGIIRQLLWFKDRYTK